VNTQFKKCTRCETAKPLDQFYRRSNRLKSGERSSRLYSQCKKCNTVRAARYADTKLARDREYRQWYRKVNAQKVAAKNRARDARSKLATPAWANAFLIEEIYDLRFRRTAATGFTWHVDHAIPLNGATVSGLHVENNLRVIPGAENVSKGNRNWEYLE
jgi:hypothetical protein